MTPPEPVEARDLTARADTARVPERLTALREAVQMLPTEEIDGDGPIGGIEDFDLIPPRIRVVGLHAVLVLIAATARADTAREETDDR